LRDQANRWDLALLTYDVNERSERKPTQAELEAERHY
jgi:hypothetical protein